MAKIIGGIGTSHAPSLAYAYDHGKQSDPDWKPVFDTYGQAKQWLAEARPDVIIAFYNDHLNRFFFDAYPTFALGIGDQHPIADEAGGAGLFLRCPGIRNWQSILQSHLFRMSLTSRSARR